MPDEPVKLLVAPCEKEAAIYAVEHWHYSRKMPRSGLRYYGVWEDGEYIGVVLFGQGATPAYGPEFLLSRQEVCELVRVALRQHKTPVTRIVSIALRLLLRDEPQLKAVLSYADTERGHSGGIYRGGNWTYLGLTTPQVKYYKPSGEEYHSRAFSARWTGARDEGRKFITERATAPKHKFIKWLDRDSERRWRSTNPKLPPRLARDESGGAPVPPRAGSADGGTASTQEERAGSTPSPAHSNRPGAWPP